MDRVRVEIVDRGNFGEKISDVVKSAILKALKRLKIKSAYVEISLLPDKEMKELNRVYRGKDEPTTVLSIEEPTSFPKPADFPNSLGEIYLAPDIIDRKKENIGRLAIHGLLHLLGYTHEKGSDIIEMEKLEQELCPVKLKRHQR